MVPYRSHQSHCRGVFDPSRCPGGVLQELAMDPYRQGVLAAGPKGLPRAGDFRLETGPMPEPLEGQVLLAPNVPPAVPAMTGGSSHPEADAPAVHAGVCG